MAEFRNVVTGQVQHVAEGTLLHRLMTANPSMYEQAEGTTKEDGDAGKPRRRRSSAQPAADADGA